MSLLLMLPMLLLAVALATYAGELVEARTEMQNSADAAALAAVQVFVDDRRLLGRREGALELLTEARAEARLYALRNPVLGEPLDLDENLDNDPDGDVVFGTVSTPRDNLLVRADVTAPQNEFLHLINTVVVQARRTQGSDAAYGLHGRHLLSRKTADLRAVASATLDRDVIGFQPVSAQPIPLAPVAVLSDPQGLARESWEHQVDRRRGGDDWRFDRQRRICVRGGDGLHEMRVRLAFGAPSAGQAQKDLLANACLLQVGVEDAMGLGKQLAVGVTREHLLASPDCAGKFVLGGDKNCLSIAGSALGPTAGGQAAGYLKACLLQLQQRGEARVWPLYTGWDQGKVVITGFVAARVVAVSDAAEGRAVNFVLQPCMLSVSSAVTDATRRGAPGLTLPNRYVCKVRLVR